MYLRQILIYFCFYINSNLDVLRRGQEKILSVSVKADIRKRVAYRFTDAAGQSLAWRWRHAESRHKQSECRTALCYARYRIDTSCCTEHCRYACDNRLGHETHLSSHRHSFVHARMTVGSKIGSLNRSCRMILIYSMQN